MQRPFARRVGTILLALLVSGSMAACSSSGSSDGSGPTTTAAASDTGGDEAATTTEPGVTTTDTETTEPGVTEPGVTETTEPDVNNGGGEGGSGKDDDRQAYLDAFAGQFDDESDLPDTFDKGQIDCLSNGFLDTIGYDNLVDAGVTPEDFAQASDFPKELGVDEAKANELYDQFGECDMDPREIFYTIIELSSGKPATDEQKACIDKALAGDVLRKSFVAGILGREPTDDPQKAVEACFGSGDEPAG